jgi:hypothetical protein
MCVIPTEYGVAPDLPMREDFLQRQRLGVDAPRADPVVRLGGAFRGLRPVAAPLVGHHEEAAQPADAEHDHRAQAAHHHLEWALRLPWCAPPRRCLPVVPRRRGADHRVTGLQLRDLGVVFALISLP